MPRWKARSAQIAYLDRLWQTAMDKISLAETFGHRNWRYKMQANRAVATFVRAHRHIIRHSNMTVYRARREMWYQLSRK